MKPTKFLIVIAVATVLASCGNSSQVTAKAPAEPTTTLSPGSTSTTSVPATTTAVTSSSPATTSPTATAAPATTVPANEPGGKYGTPGGGKGSISFAAMRGDVLEAWGNGGKVLEAVACDTRSCNVQAVTATKTDIFVAISTMHADGASMDSEIWRYPVSGGRAESIYRAKNATLSYASATTNGDLYVQQSTTDGSRQMIRRIRNGEATDAVAGNIQSLSASRDGTTVAYTVLDESDPTKYVNALWVLNSTTGKTRLVTADGSVAANVAVSADGTMLQYYNMNSLPTGQMSLRNLADDAVTYQAGSAGCLPAGGTPITWEYSETGMTVIRGSGTQTLPASFSSPGACRPDGALIGLLEPQAGTAAATATAVAAEGDNGSMEHVCGIGVSSGDLAVVRADGTTTRLGHDYHRVFQL
jgi:hypothetical protein